MAAVKFEPQRSPLWNAFVQMCREERINLEDDEIRERAWAIWYKGFTCGVVNAGSPKLGKLSDAFDSQLARHELGYWSVVEQKPKPEAG